MTILAGNFASKMSCCLQFRVFSNNWGKRSTAMLRLKGRDYNNSSVPIRYIPKISSKVDDSENSLPVKGFEKVAFTQNLRSTGETFGLDKKAQKRNGIPSSLYEPGKEINLNFSIDNNKLMKEPEDVNEEMRIHKASPFDIKTKQDAEKVAVELLATRAFTSVELRKKLCGKKFPPHLVEALVTDFQSRGLINDSWYAEIFCRSRWSSRSWGPKRIKQALYSKGVSQADMEKAIKLVFEEGEHEDQDSKLGMSKNSMDHLMAQASKQWLRGQDVPKETRKSRIVRWLQYRGFDWGVISIVLKKLEAQYPR
ncbi:hypothetical protein K2173_014483 [Erythroxylum novogranatense]|uniref:Regulatory protein RecX n=1 Tax=Erythroxylum novogranatense TaxID=1862640 RepID=A0AAV8S4U1_9ROSI|nr:hypothetical protein K2173_014483 [Erythroxylum novogranatense]